MTIIIANRRSQLDNLRKKHGDDIVIKIATSKTIVRLDYQTNGDLDDLRTPLSHAALVKRYLEKDRPV